MPVWRAGVGVLREVKQDKSMLSRGGTSVNSPRGIEALKSSLPDSLSILMGMKKKLCGPCFRCGGKDRLCVWPAKGDIIDILFYAHRTDIAAIPRQSPRHQTAKRTPPEPFIYFGKKQ